MDVEAKADRAAQILDNEVFQEAAARAKQRMKDAWANEEDPQKREALWQQYKASEAVTRELTITRDNGIVARNKRQKEEQRA